MPTLVHLTPKKHDALVDCATGTLRRCRGGYRLPTGENVHSKRVINQLAADGLVTVDSFETEASITADGRAFAQITAVRPAA